MMVLALAAALAAAQAAPAKPPPRCVGPASARPGAGEAVRVGFAPPLGEPLDYEMTVTRWDELAGRDISTRTYRLRFAALADGYQVTAQLLSVTSDPPGLPPQHVWAAMLTDSQTVPVGRDRSLPPTNDDERRGERGEELRLRSFAIGDLANMLGRDPPELARGETRYVERPTSAYCQTSLEAPAAELRYRQVERDDDYVVRRRAAAIAARVPPSQRAQIVEGASRLRFGGFLEARLSRRTGMILDMVDHRSDEIATSGDPFRSWVEIRVKLLNPTSAR